MLPRATLRAGIWAGEIAARSRMCRNDALGEDTLGVKGARLNANRRSVQQAMPTGRHTIPLYAKCDILAWSRPRRIAKAVASGNFTGA